MYGSMEFASDMELFFFVLFLTYPTAEGGGDGGMGDEGSSD